MKKQNVFVVGINGGIWEVFDSKEKVIELFEKELEGKFEFDGEEEMGVEEGVEYLLKVGEVVRCLNVEVCEMGDDYCELSVIEREIN